jgi:O-antigen ligase
MLRVSPPLTMAAAPVAAWLLLRHGVLVIAAVAFLALIVLALRRTDIAVLALAGVMPLAVRVAHGQTAVLVATLMVMLGAALRMATDMTPLRVRHVAVLPLFAALLVSFAYPGVPLVTQTSRFADLAGLLSGLALLAASTAVPPRAKHLARMTVLVGASIAIYLLIRGDYADNRIEGLGLNPNYVGLLSALPLVAGVGLAWRHRAPAWLVPAAPCLAVVVASESRGAFLAVAVGVSMILMSGRSKRVRILISVGALLAALLVPGSLGVVEDAGVAGRAAAELNYNTVVREHAARLALDVVAAHPVRGIGYDMFAPYAAMAPQLGVYMNTHDDYLRLAAEAGLPALAMFLAVLWWAAKDHRTDDLAVLRAVVLTYATGLLFANTLSNVAVTAPFWAALGCLLAHASAPARLGHTRSSLPAMRINDDEYPALARQRRRG